MSDTAIESLEIKDAVRDSPAEILKRASSARSEPTLCLCNGETGSTCCSYCNSCGGAWGG